MLDPKLLKAIYASHDWLAVAPLPPPRTLPTYVLLLIFLIKKSLQHLQPSENELQHLHPKTIRLLWLLYLS